MKLKFKQGDVVRAIRKGSPYYGHLGIVRGFGRKGHTQKGILYAVQLMSDPDDRRYFYASSLEKANDEVQSG